MHGTDSIEIKVVPIKECLKTLRCEPFFVFDRKSNKINISLDNPFELRIPKRTGKY